MGIIVSKFRIFFDIEKETRWLNNLSKQGYRFVDKKCFNYYFKKCEPNEFIYQIERRKLFSSKKNKDYIDFISSLNINIVSTQWGWFYFEKENDGNEFNIYSDVPSKISHYKNLIITLLLIGFVSSFIIVDMLLTGIRGPYILNISYPIVANSFIILAVIFTIIKYLLKIYKLKKEDSFSS